jgi:hypothetical protein
MDSEYRAEKAALAFSFWAIIDANWQPWEIAQLVAWCKAFEDIRR